MTIKPVSRYFLASMMLGTFLIFNACQSTIVNPIMEGPDFKSTGIHKVLIISISSTPEIRKRVEEEFARQFNMRGIQAFTSLAVLPDGTPLDKANVSPYAHQHGFDTVLVSRLIKRQTLDKKANVQSGGTDHARTLSDDLRWSVASPDYPGDFEVAFLQTSLYDVATEHKMWSAESQTLVTSDVAKRIRPYVKVMMRTMFETN